MMRARLRLTLIFIFGLGLAALLSLGTSGGIGDQLCTVTLSPEQPIQEAINGAKEGDVICLAAGTWKESVVIEKGLTLRAVEVKPEPEVVIQSAKKGWPVILIRSEEAIEVVLQGLKVTGAFGWCYQYKPERICADGISVHGRAKAVIQNNTISGNNWHGILMLDSAQATIQNTTISGNEDDGILMLDSAQATIENDTISGNEDGILMGGSAQATIQNNTISNNYYGIRMEDSAQATIEHNTISGNKEDGIRMEDSAQASIQNNTIQNNRLCGIRSSSNELARGEGNLMKGNGVDLCGNLSKALRLPLVPETTQKELTFPGPYASLQETIDALAPGGTITIAAGEHQGGLTIWKPLTLKGGGREQTTLKGAISLIDEAQGVMIQGVKITGSLLVDGILLGGRAQATIQGNTISDNMDGILMLDSSQATIENNTISGNRAGILMLDSSQATIENNTISDSTFGILMSDSAQATIENNTISGNGTGIEMWGSSQATIEDNNIRNNGSCGIISSSQMPVQGRGNHMEGNGVDLCGNLSAALRLPLVPETTQRELAFPGPYDSLQKTIDALAPGGTIVVAAGEHQGGLTIWKPLTLKGAGWEQTTIRGMICLIDEAQGVTIQGLTITNSSFEGIVLGGRAQATIEHSSISDNKYDGIGMWGSSQATIEHSSISDNKYDGIEMWGSSQATIEHSSISDNKYDGIRMWDSSRATIQNNKIINNGRYGVACYQRPCFDTDWKFAGAVRGRNNEISGNRKADVCPQELEFLRTAAGGCYGPKC